MAAFTAALAAAAGVAVEGAAGFLMLVFGWFLCAILGMMLSGRFCRLFATEPGCLSLAERPRERCTAPLPSRPRALRTHAPSEHVGHWPAPEPSRAPPAVVRAAPPKSPQRLWRLDSQFYDLTAFIKSHPGGELALSQTMGTDITALFHSHHMRDVPQTLLAKYRVEYHPPEGVAAIEPCDYSFDEKGFFQTCKRRIQAMGLTSGVREVTPLYVLQVSTVFATFLVSWYAVCFLPLGKLVTVLALVNMWMRMCLTGIGHEAIHGRLRNRLTWELFDMVMLFPSDAWHLEHVTQHHPHCKRLEYDPDEILDPLRLCEQVPWTPLHTFQAPLQAILVFASVISCIDKHLINRTAVVKGVFYLVVLHLAPFFTRDTWGEAWLLAGLSVGAANLTIVLCFHLSHINGSNALHARFQAGGDWGAHQLITSTNFKGSLGTFFYSTGMLDMQIEHHLFPSLSYANQRRIKPIVEQCAKDFGLPYYEYSSGLHGIAGHLYHMHELAWADTPSPPALPTEESASPKTPLLGPPEKANNVR